MSLLAFCRIAVSLFAPLCGAAPAQNSVFTSPLPTGVRLDAVGDTVELGSMPLKVVAAPRGMDVDGTNVVDIISTPDLDENFPSWGVAP